MTAEIPISSYLISALKMTVRINGVHTPLAGVPDSIKRFVRPFLVHNSDDFYHFSVKGTCILIKFFNKLFVVATKHQLGAEENERQSEEVCISIDGSPIGGKLYISASTISTISFGDDVDHRFAEDILFLEYDPKKYNHDISSCFLHLTDELFELDKISRDQVMFFFSLGYPSRLVGLELNEDDPENVFLKEIRTGYTKIFLEYVGTLEQYHITLRLRPNIHLDVADCDGFSGAPVFFVYQDITGQCKLGFAGIVRQGGNGLFHIYDAMYLKQLLLKIVTPAQHA
jgi:hypothetical protein